MNDNTNSSKHEITSLTKVTKNDAANAWADEFGVIYSTDKKRLLCVPVDIREYSIPEGTEVICDWAFNECELLQSIELCNSLVAIGFHAFHNCSSLRTIIIPSNVAKIGTGAFFDCDSLQTVSISEGVKIIGEEAFGCCSSLKSIDLPNSLTTIGDYAFDGCSSLKSIIIPSSVTNIGRAPFSFCHCEITSKSEYFRSNGFDLYSVKDKTLLYCWPTVESYNISDFISIIGEGAFSLCKKLKSIVIPNSVTTIESIAYCGCESLSEIELSNSLTEIGENAFSGCNALTDITIPDSVTQIGDGAFSNCASLKRITILNSDINIGKGAFGSCDALSKIHIPAGSYDRFKQLLPGLEDRFFVDILSNSSYHYSHISSQTSAAVDQITTDVTDEDYDEGFEECGVIYSPDGMRLLQLDRNSYHDNSYSIEQGTKVICDGAFAWCNGLTRITIPDSVTHIGKHAFECCGSLTNIIIPDSVIFIGKGAFSLYNDLINIQVSSNNTIYDSRENCNAIIHTATNTLLVGCKNTIIPDSVTHIGNYAFDYCICLGCITIPNSVTHIGDGVFYGCKALTCITLPDSVISIGEDIFKLCDSLSEIHIPTGCYDKFKNLLPGFADIFVEDSL